MTRKEYLYCKYIFPDMKVALAYTVVSVLVITCLYFKYHM